MCGIFTLFSNDLASISNPWDILCDRSNRVLQFYRLVLGMAKRLNVVEQPLKRYSKSLPIYLDRLIRQAVVQFLELELVASSQLLAIPESIQLVYFEYLNQMKTN